MLFVRKRKKKRKGSEKNCMSNSAGCSKFDIKYRILVVECFINILIDAFIYLVSGAIFESKKIFCKVYSWRNVPCSEYRIL